MSIYRDGKPPGIFTEYEHRYLLVNNSEISGIIDWGDMTSGDVATDLAALWMLIEDDETRDKAILKYQDERTSTGLRARGWATIFGLYFVGYSSRRSPTTCCHGRTYS